MNEHEKYEKQHMLDVIATALAKHRDSYDSTDLPTEYHGYAQAVADGLFAEGFRIVPVERLVPPRTSL